MAIGDNVGLLFRIKAQNQTKGEFNEVDRDLAKLSGSATGLSSSFAALANPATIVATTIAAVGAAALTATAALWNITKAASDFGSEINDAAEKSGLSVRSISALKVAADQSGASLVEVASSMSKFTKVLADAALGATDAKEKLIRLGLDPLEAHKDLEGSLAAVIKRIYEIDDPIAKGKLAIDAFGKSGRDLIPVINTTKGNFEEFIKKADKLGLVLSNDAVKAADEFGDRLDELKAVVQSTALTFAKEFMPIVTSVMRNTSVAVANNKDVISAWGKQVNNVIQGVIVSLKFLGNIADGIFNAIGVGALSLESKVRLIISTSPLLSILSAIGEYFGVKGAALGGAAKPLKPSVAFEFTDEESANKAAEERKKREQEELAARQRFLAASKESIQQAFDELQAITRKNYEDQLVTAEKFHSDFEENERQFRVRMIELVEADFKIQIAQAKNATERAALEIEKRTAIEKIISDSDARINDSQKLVTDTQKKNSEERIQNAENEVNRKIEAAEAYVNKQIALLEAEDLAESERIARQGVLEAALLKAKKHALEELLKFVKGNADKEAEIKIKIDNLDAEITRNSVGNSKARKAAIEAETKALIEWNKEFDARVSAERPRYAGGDRGKPPSEGATARDDVDFFESLANSMRELFGLSEKLPTLASVFTDFAGIVMNAFQGVAQAIGSVIQQWVLYGKTGPAIMRQILASALATIAAEAAVRAIYHLAMGFALLFFNPGAAAEQFIAAALFGSIAVGAALTGRAVAGSAFKQQTQAATGQTGANTQSSQGRGGAYSGQGDQTIESGRNAPGGIAGTIVIRDKSGMFDQLFEAAWDKNGRMRNRLQLEFGR